MPCSKTYRVQGLPVTFTKEDCRRLISSILAGTSENPEPTIHSLSVDPYAAECSIATVTFNSDPAGFQDGRDEWTVTIPRPRISTHNAALSSITIDTHFLGFTPLDPIQESSDHCIDCIAITGLSSHPFGSWKQRNGQYMWLRDGLPHDLKGARVLAYGYNTNLLRSQAFQSVDDIAIAFCKSIRSIRRRGNDKDRPRPLVFISHSLGGVVLKRAILEMKNGDDIDNENFNSVYGVLFFGVPNQGIRIEHWLPMVKGQPNENLVRNLGPESTYLSKLHEDFRTAFDFPDSEVVFVYETERTRVAERDEHGRWALTGSYEVLVPINSATDSSSKNHGHHVLPIKQNHSDLVKFSSRWDESYRLVLAHLKDFSAAAFEVIRGRLSKSADGNSNEEIPQTDDWTPLHRAAFIGNETKLRAITDMQIHMEAKDANGRTPVHIASCYGREAATRLLLDKGAYNDTRNYTGQTPLHDAASRGHVLTVSLLLNSHADVESRDGEQKTSLYAAARHGHEAVERLLIAHGANKEARGNGGWTPLHAAARYGHEPAAQTLLQAGAERDALAENGQTPLYVAAKAGHAKVTRLLLKHGAKRNSRARDGWAPLHAAAWYGHESALRVLVEGGADVEARSDDDKTPLIVAARNGHEAVVRLLVGRGANRRAKDEAGLSSWDVAKRNGHKGVAKLLGSC